MALGRLEVAAQRLDALLPELEASVGKLGTASPNERWALNGQVDSAMAEANTVLGRMASDARALGPDEQDFWGTSIGEYRDTVARVTASLQEKRSSAQSQVADTNARAAEAGQRAQGQLAEAITIGREVVAEQERQLGVLADDAQRLDGIQRNVEGIDAEAEGGLARLKRMWWRALLHKLVGWVVVAVLLGLLVLSAAIKFGVIVPGRNEGPTATPAQTRTELPQ
jgi:hypothetical protein